jgi:hypothetical protein
MTSKKFTFTSFFKDKRCLNVGQQLFKFLNAVADSAKEKNNLNFSKSCRHQHLNVFSDVGDSALNF